MKTVYHTFTGNCARFARLLDENATPITDLPTADEDILLVFPTVGFGQVPPIVKRYLQTNREHIKFVVSSGNRNWGPNFAKGADIITQHLGIPSYKIELAGTAEDVENIKKQIATLSKNP